jgi:hypothetical protein
MFLQGLAPINSTDESVSVGSNVQVRSKDTSRFRRSPWFTGKIVEVSDTALKVSYDDLRHNDDFWVDRDSERLPESTRRKPQSKDDGSVEGEEEKEGQEGVEKARKNRKCIRILLAVAGTMLLGLGAAIAWGYLHQSSFRDTCLSLTALFIVFGALQTLRNNMAWVTCPGVSWPDARPSYVQSIPTGTGYWVKLGVTLFDFVQLLSMSVDESNFGVSSSSTKWALLDFEAMGIGLGAYGTRIQFWISVLASIALVIGGNLVIALPRGRLFKMLDCPAKNSESDSDSSNSSVIDIWRNVTMLKGSNMHRAILDARNEVSEHELQSGDDWQTVQVFGEGEDQKCIQVALNHVMFQELAMNESLPASFIDKEERDGLTPKGREYYQQLGNLLHRGSGRKGVSRVLWPQKIADLKIIAKNSESVHMERLDQVNLVVALLLTICCKKVLIGLDCHWDPVAKHLAVDADRSIECFVGEHWFMWGGALFGLLCLGFVTPSIIMINAAYGSSGKKGLTQMNPIVHAITQPLRVWVLAMSIFFTKRVAMVWGLLLNIVHLGLELLFGTSNCYEYNLWNRTKYLCTTAASLFGVFATGMTHYKVPWTGVLLGMWAVICIPLFSYEVKAWKRRLNDKTPDIKWDRTGWHFIERTLDTSTDNGNGMRRFYKTMEEAMQETYESNFSAEERCNPAVQFRVGCTTQTRVPSVMSTETNVRELAI